MVEYRDMEAICCPSCGNRVAVLSIYVCRTCRGVFCFSGQQCGVGKASVVCPNSECRPRQGDFYDECLDQWIEKYPTVRESKLSVDELIRQVLIENQRAVAQSKSVVDVIRYASRHLPFSVIPNRELANARPQLRETRRRWADLVSEWGENCETWSLDSLTDLQLYVGDRLSHVLLSRQSPTTRQVMAEVSGAVNTIETLPDETKETEKAIVRAIRAMDVTLHWLEGDAAWAPRVFDTCEKAMDAFTEVRDRDTATLEERKTFLTHARRLWRHIEWLLLSEAEYYQITDRAVESTAVEMTLLRLLEQFENRMLFEERRLIRLPVVRSSADSIQSKGVWGFEPPWHGLELSEWSTQGIDKWLECRQHSTQRSTPDRSTCLGMNSAINQSHEGDHTFFQSSDDQGAVASVDLVEMIPRQCVWIRCLFDSEERLRWWAWTNKDQVLERIAFGKSPPGALGRLQESLERFDARTSQAWLSFNHWIATPNTDRPDFRNCLRALTDTVANRVVDGLDEEFYDAIDRELDYLKHDWPALAKAGKTLVQWLRAKGEGAFPVEIWEHWNAGPDRCRQIELDVAHRELVQCLSNELDLTNLAQCRASINWTTTDVLFQVQGPLLAMPLAWLPFRGRGLFRSVASTSTSVSLALREETRSRIGNNVKPNKSILSTHWEEPSNRDNAHGLPLLHAAVHRLAAEYDFEAHSLGDDPPASIDNLLNLLQQQFGVVVIGAHGGETAPGIKLRDEFLWCGENADLSSVDVLILCCCAVGRLTQEGGRDVEGMYSRLAAHGARCTVAARWVIADQESAIFMGEFLKQYLHSYRKQNKVRPFDRARALNRARRNVISGRCSSIPVGQHAVGAFEMFGLG